jgi:DNA-binding NtrC family response regulator
MMIDRTIQLLVVDDDPELLAVLECGLAQQPDYGVRAVDNAPAALRAVQAGGWDLLVTDYALNDPQLNGIDLLRAARALPEPPLVIIITAFASLQITLESIKLGAHSFLTKPFQLDELFLAVRNAVAAIRLDRENQVLRRQVTEFAHSLAAIERQHQQLVERLRRLGYEGNPERLEEMPSAALNTVPAMELRRRRLRDQVAAYLRAGEGVGRQLQEERRRIEGVIESHAEG